MKQEYFTNPTLSKKLERLGIESQFDFWWVYEESDNGVDLEWNFWIAEPYKEEDGSYQEEIKNVVKAYHFSDILLPDNAKKIWPEGSGKIWYRCTVILLNNVGFGDKALTNWQEWLLEELNKQEV